MDRIKNLLGGMGLALLAAAVPISAAGQIDFSGLDKWRAPGAQRCALMDCSGRSAGSNWHGLVTDVRNAGSMTDSAARDLQYFASISGDLDNYSRRLLDSLPESERRSVVVAYQAVTGRVRNALAANAALRTRISALQSDIARLQSRLSELERSKSETLAEIVQVRSGIASLQEQIARTRERQQRVEQDAAVAESLSRDTQLSARAARSSYWAVAREFFDGNKLGTPRDFIPPVEAGSAYAERRRIVTGPANAAALALPSMPIAARAAIVPAPAAVAAAAPQAIDRDAFLRLMGQWRGALDNTDRLQSQAGAVASAAADSARLIDRKAAQVADLRPPLEQGRAEEAGLQLEAAALQVAVERRLAQGQAAVREVLDNSKETLVWQLAEESLRMGLSPMASAAQRFVMIGAVGRAYQQLFTEDIPTFMALMGPNPPEDAQEKYESLLHLDSRYGQQILAQAFFSNLDMEGGGSSELPKQELHVFKAPDESKVSGFRVLGWERAKDGERGLQFLKKPDEEIIHFATGLTHGLSHTEQGMTEFLSFPSYKKFIDDRVAKGIDHSVFVVKPSEYLDFLDGMWNKVQTGKGAVPAPPELVKEAREGYKYFLVDLGAELGRTGYTPGPTPAWSEKTSYAMFIYKDIRTFVTAYAVQLKK